ncbi:MAG: 16S rRNA (adenine(1518)-N(6)/adenine(1519)-N(6))-dimethyltransferase RsmA [Flavobacteriales bacterium]
MAAFFRYLRTVVRAKKRLGQHFLNDRSIAEQIVQSLSHNLENVLEVGAGTGALTHFLSKRPTRLKVIDIDSESIAFLKAHYAHCEHIQIIQGDFLKRDITQLFDRQPFALIGNFPYNISTQIIFKVLQNKDYIPEWVGVFQKEVAERVAAAHGRKIYGIPTVLTQVFYEVAYCFTLDEQVFSPPPKVKSGVLHLLRKAERPAVDEALFFQVVKKAFRQRRKTLRNALKGLPLSDELKAHHQLDSRAEQLSVSDFVQLTKQIEAARNAKT